MPRSDWQNNNHTKIQDIKVNKGETGDINQATISFIGSTNNTVETYIQKTNADNWPLNYLHGKSPRQEPDAVDADRMQWALAY